MGCSQSVEAKRLARGGPPRLETNADGSLRAVNVFYKPRECCNTTNNNLLEEDRTVPPELAALGLKQSEWTEWMEDRLRPVQQHLAPQFWWALGATVTCGVSLCICKNAPYHDGLREWQAEFNKTVGKKYGIFLKTRSVARLESVGTRPHRFVSAYFAFAVTPESIEWLKGVPHNYGALSQGCCGEDRDSVVLLE